VGRGTGAKWEGEAAAEPNSSASREMGNSAGREKDLAQRSFALTQSFQTPNKFGAQGKFVINHWLKPVAWLVLEHTPKSD